jgi:hypothetical protein
VQCNAPRCVGQFGDEFLEHRLPACYISAMLTLKESQKSKGAKEIVLQ